RLSYWISRMEGSGMLSLSISTSYKKQSLIESLEEHYSMILPNLKSALDSLVVYPPTVPIPLEVLSLVVPVDVVDNEDVIHELSMVMNELSKMGWVDEVREEENKTELYRVPRVVHEFLVRRVDNEEKKEMKNQLMRGEEKVQGDKKKEMVKCWMEEYRDSIGGNDSMETSNIGSLVGAFQSLFSWV
ncbi:hypothetical protein PFISCL1PPCAC_10604, partial [Pristionchus fissidentatus]